MTPIWRLCKRTESALSFLESGFHRAPLDALIGAVGVEGAFFAFALLIRLQTMTNERSLVPVVLHRGTKARL